LRDAGVKFRMDTALSIGKQIRRDIMRIVKILSSVLLLASILVLSGEAFAKDRTTGRDRGPVVYVTSHGLYYDSIVVADPLPPHGRFQQLIPSENGLETEFGPGDHGHVGGRWWIDLDENEMMDPGDKYFLCPLLGPGRPTL
jgi:hypothetical protein